MQVFNMLNKIYILSFLLVALQGCALFVSHYDAGAYQYFTSLKAFHVKFLEDNTIGYGKTYNETQAKAVCDSGELKFREASEYAAGKNDESRINAINYVHNVFKKNCNLLIVKDKNLFGITYTDEQILDIKKNYDFAIAGESSRVGASSK